MKFSTKEDIEAPIDYVFARVTDFNGFERQALRRGADIKRIDEGVQPTVGAAWQVAFKFRGKDRKMKATIAQMDVPTVLQIDTAANGITGESLIELVALSRNRTRLSVTLDLSPQSLTARLLLQSLKLAKNNLTRKFKMRITDFAEDVETSYGKSA
ncbi:MAG: SRPBCC family protein [Yoonia sp.]|nr:SRPBCC family protein [Yoonia sp.]